MILRTMMFGAAFAVLSLSAATQAFATGYSYTVLAETETTTVAGGFSGLSVPAINDSGFVTFGADYICQVAGSISCHAIYTTYPSGSLTQIVTSGPTNVLPVTDFVQPEINDVNEIGYEALTSNADGSTTDALFQWKSDTIKQIAPNEGTYHYVDPTIMASGDEVFYGNGSGKDFLAVSLKTVRLITPSTSVSNLGTDTSPSGYLAYRGVSTSPAESGIFLNKLTGATVFKVADNASYGQLIQTTVNNSAVIAFSGRDLPGFATNVNGLFEMKPSGSVKTLATIDNGSCTLSPPSDGSACIYKGYDSTLAINSKNAVAATVDIFAWNESYPGSQSETFEVTLNGDLVNGVVAAPGMIVNGCAVIDAYNGQRAINKLGQIVFETDASCAGSSVEMIVLATPQ